MAELARTVRAVGVAQAARAVRRRTVVGLAALAGLAVLLAGCGGARELSVAGVPVTGASEGRVGDITVADALFTWQGPIGDGTVYQPGDTASVRATIVNDGAGPDRLVSVSSPIAGGGEVVGPATIPANHALAAGYTGPLGPITPPDTTPIGLRLTDLNTPILAGLSYPVEFTFAHAGTLRLQLRVANPDVPVPECPLPPDGKIPSTFTAPVGRAPAPPTSPAPDCSSLR